MVIHTTDWEAKAYDAKRRTWDQEKEKHKDQNCRHVNETRQGTHTAKETERPDRHEDTTGEAGTQRDLRGN